MLIKELKLIKVIDSAIHCTATGSLLGNIYRTEYLQKIFLHQFDKFPMSQPNGRRGEAWASNAGAPLPQ